MPSKHFTYDPVTFQQKEVQKNSQYYYKPKIDMAAGFHIRGGFIDFLIEMSVRLKSDAIHFPLLQYIRDKQVKDL
ncbi:hypothetical protein [Bacillus sp. V5-8f]|uniref:hypothetical protein n=1 Tax=Bacillus sp. V5-8f TaxID=2053044 RepID=UPI000C783DC7|nr:hypothetical protein [Bacillus sp. V5-8f]PLT33475.1 hypothetical protein CUU64_12925 [Bacillus sp. V5-8f]